MKNIFHIGRDFGWFIGSFDNNQQHKHYAIQLSIPLNSSITIQTPTNTQTSEFPLLIKPNVVHRITSDTAQFLLLINPASTIGHFWNKASEAEIGDFTQSPATEIQNLLCSDLPDSTRLQTQINAQIMAHDCFCSSFLHLGDDRINRALGFLKENGNRIVSLEEIAGHCHLSPSRFLHLHKEQTGISFRRTQLWSKLVNGIKLMPGQSLTEVAHAVGFSDSAHFSRTFRESFGFSPREFLKFSQFIQV